MQHLLVVHRQNRQRVNSESNFLAEDFSNFESVKYFSIEENRSFEFTVVNLSFFCLGIFFLIQLNLRSLSAFIQKPILTMKLQFLGLVSALSLNDSTKLEHNTVLISYWGDNTAMCVYLARLLFAKEKVTICRLHHSDCLPVKNQNWALSNNLHLLSFDQCFFVTEGIRNQVCRYTKGLHRSSDVAYLIGNRKTKYRRTFNSQSSINLISVSTNVRVKRWDRIVHLANSLSEFCSVNLHICGPEGHWKITELVGKCENMSLFYYGFADNELKETLFRLENSCLINLSESEGLPHTFIEAFGNGVPVISTQLPAYKEFSYESGWLQISKLEDFDYQNLASWIRSSQENGIESILTFLHERKLSVKLRSFISKTVT